MKKLSDYQEITEQMLRIAQENNWDLLPVTKDNYHTLPRDGYEYDDDDPDLMIDRSYLFNGPPPKINIGKITYEINSIYLNDYPDYTCYTLMLTNVNTGRCLSLPIQFLNHEHPKNNH